MTDPLDLAHLRRLVDAATPGKWRAHPHHDLHEGPCVDTPSGLFIATTATDPPDHAHGKADATYIAAFSPPTTRALLDMVEELAGALEALLIVDAAGECEAMHPDLADEMARAALAKVRGGQS